MLEKKWPTLNNYSIFPIIGRTIKRMSYVKVHQTIRETKKLRDKSSEFINITKRFFVDSLTFTHQSRENAH